MLSRTGDDETDSAQEQHEAQNRLDGGLTVSHGLEDVLPDGDATDAGNHDNDVQRYVTVCELIVSLVDGGFDGVD